MTKINNNKGNDYVVDERLKPKGGSAKEHSEEDEVELTMSMRASNYMVLRAVKRWSIEG